jgi:hypothetical protein
MANWTIDSTNRIAEELMIREIKESYPKRPFLNGWTSSKRSTSKGKKKNLSYNPSEIHDRIKIEVESKAITAKHSNMVKNIIIIK